jgi:hypothetical protein
MALECHPFASGPPMSLHSAGLCGAIASSLMFAFSVREWPAEERARAHPPVLVFASGTLCL